MELGFDLLIITSDDYNKNNKNINTINKCMNFLLDD